MFHVIKSLLKVPKRVLKDLCNKSAEAGSQLTTTIAYLTNHGLGVLRVRELLRIYHLVIIEDDILVYYIIIVTGLHLCHVSEPEPDIGSCPEENEV